MRRSVLCLFMLVLPALGVAGPTVSVQAGKVTGITADGLDIFKGIPYAAPPVGDLRWAPPAPSAPWDKAILATEFGPACPQPERPDAARRFGPQSEDCLTLNVWTPANAKNAPVMVWIHGGAFRVGKAGTPFYDGTGFAKQGIVLVSINYRLGYLGFFAHPALTAAHPRDLLGNYGIMDQIAALRWVQKNIASFGGDPARVTVFGESAGGSSILQLLGIADAQGLFSQAIIESGGGTQRPRYLARDLPGAPSLEHIGEDMAKQLGITDARDPIAALRSLPAATIVKGANVFAVGGIGFGPVIDGKLITQPVFASFVNGAVSPVPIIIGSNSNEASVLAAFQTSASAMLDLLGPFKEKARTVYAAETGDEALMADRIFGDVSFVGPARAVARAQSNVAKTYLYHLDFVREKAKGDVKGANHGADVVLVFNTLDAIPMSRFVFTDNDRKVADTVHGYWVNFARTGNPNGEGLPLWPTYNTEKDELLLIGNPRVGAVAHFRQAQLDFITDVINAASAAR